MRRDKKRKTLQQTLSSIDGVLAALNSYPNLEDALLEQSQSVLNKHLGKLFPTQLDFNNKILEHIVGTNVMVDIITKFLTVALPGVEVSLKAALLANMQNLGTNCTIDPFIYEKAIKEGVIFDLKQIDLIDKLSVSPLDRRFGQYYYFGIEGCESSYDILQSAIDPNNQTYKQRSKGVQDETSYSNKMLNDSVGHYFGGRKRDFDCLLWYMKNKAAYREVWGKRTTQSEDIFNGGENISDWINKKGDKKTRYYSIKNGTVSFHQGGGTGTLVEMTDGNTYKFWEGDTQYEYSYGNPQIKKISQKKCYYSKAHGIFYYDGNQWVKTNLTYQDNYHSMEQLPTTISVGDWVMVDGFVYQIKNEPKIKYHKKGDDGTKYVSDVKYEECIDITNDLVNNTYLFVDYALGTNAKDLKDGKTVTSTFNHLVTNNTGQKVWFKKKVSSQPTTPTGDDNVYYIKKSKGKFDAHVDVIMIQPYEVSGNKVKPSVFVNDLMEKDNKYTKEFGVLTLDFSPRTGNVTQSDGTPMQQQTPYDNVLHVFFGNVKELHTAKNDEIYDSWGVSADANKLAQTVVKKLKKLVETNGKVWVDREKALKKSNQGSSSITSEQNLFESAKYCYNRLLNGDNQLKTNISHGDAIYSQISELSKKMEVINSIIDKNAESLYKGGVIDEILVQSFYGEILGVLDGYAIRAYVKRISSIMEENENMVYLSAKNLKYPDAKNNYYYLKTLFEFNTDYVNSLQLFDPKVLTAQLISSLFGGVAITASMGLPSLSWKHELIHNTVKNMVEKVIASEDIAVSDCFFTFSNDSYNDMLRATELKQAGLYSLHGEQNGNRKIDPIKLLEGLNNIDDAADQAEQIDIIKGVIMSASAEVSKDEYRDNGSLAFNSHYGVQVSFIETLMINLCTQCVMAMLSPKVYLLILVNLHMFGLSTNFALKDFIERFSDLIRSIVKSVVNQFMQYIQEEIMRIVEELVQKLMVKMKFEQVEMYARLLKQIFMHLRMLWMKNKGQNMGWVQDVIGYADIISSENQEPIDEC